MDRALLFIVLLLVPLSSAFHHMRPAHKPSPKLPCKMFQDRSTASLILRCNQLTNLKTLDLARSNLTAIEIADSEIPDLPGYLFIKFRDTLAKLDLHGIGIQKIDQATFSGLSKLEVLLLWGNKLQWILGSSQFCCHMQQIESLLCTYMNILEEQKICNTVAVSIELDGALFRDTPNLKMLDVSFNKIQVIQREVFTSLPNLESFYFDYNQLTYIEYWMFDNLKNLKNVKFEKNPLNWGYRAHLTWQLDNQRVKYTEEWEDWAWMNAMIKECADSGHGEIPKDVVLDCIVGKLLDFAHEIFSTETRQQKNECIINAQRVARCMRPRNVTGNSDNETVRRALEGYAEVLVQTTKSQGRFSMQFRN